MNPLRKTPGLQTQERSKMRMGGQKKGVKNISAPVICVGMATENHFLKTFRLEIPGNYKNEIVG